MHKDPQRFYKLGSMYGYPKCCITEFIVATQSGYYLFRGERKLNGSGYIPCLHCNARYTSQELIDNINARRDKSIQSFNFYLPVL